MIDITVTVSGPGGCINYEAELIKRSLELVGFTVNMTNDYPIEEQAATFGGKPHTVTEYMDAVNARGVKLPSVTMKVNNCPWGG